MATHSAPIVSLQAPKDVSIGEVEAELSKIWQSYNAGGDSSTPAATRAATFSLIVYEPEETQQVLAALGFYKGPLDGITGPATRSALKAAQTAYGLPADGRTSSEILERLRQEYTRRQGEAGLEASLNAAAAASYAGGMTMADAIANQNPCRIVALCPTLGEDKGATAQVSAYCPMQKQSRSTLICCEYITLTGTTEALERVGSMVNSLLIPELPRFLWWKATPDLEHNLFRQLSGSVSCVIVDSSGFAQAETDLLTLHALSQQLNIADLNWRRLAAWQELTAEAFDPPERRASLIDIDQVTIDYEKGNPSQALLFLGWLASRLQWTPCSYRKEGGDYDIVQISLKATDGRSVNAELAGIPTANWGEVAGDLVGLRLMSSNTNADCCTILCSETTGCMRMEAGGSAQSCRVQQVSSLTDQEAENLLSQQLQRWGRDPLYEESLTVTAAILKLNPNPDEG